MYLHVYNRGVRKSKIFLDQRDYARFLFLIIYCQSDPSFRNLGRQVDYYVQHRMFNINIGDTQEIVATKKIDLLNFCLMPNHFHLTLVEHEPGAISSYMQRVLNAYTKYFNTRYKVSGHLFQGKYKRVIISTDEQLAYLSAYIHKNPKELGVDWQGYEWSSMKDYTGENRWPGLLSVAEIRNTFTSSEEYGFFVKSCAAKEGDL